MVALKCLIKETSDRHKPKKNGELCFFKITGTSNLYTKVCDIQKKKKKKKKKGAIKASLLERVSYPPTP